MPTSFDYFEKVIGAFESVSHHDFSRLLSLIKTVSARGGRIYVIGNGGSAATAAHMVCDLDKCNVGADDRRIRAYTLADKVPTLTAWANDADYSQAFARQLASMLDPGDLVIAISVSGNSENIILALEEARRLGAHSAGLLGHDGHRAEELLDVSLHVSHLDYGVVETVHLGIVHALAAQLRGAADVSLSSVMASGPEVGSVPRGAGS